MITIEDFAKIELKVGKIISKSNRETLIECNGKEFSTRININTNKNDKIIIAINGDEVIIPLINHSIPLVPDKDIETGSKVR